MIRKFPLLLLFALSLVLGACSNHRSYAELLSDETKEVNNFLADQIVIGYTQRDSTFKFEYGEDAPYYQIDEDGNLYMQVIKPGTPGNFAETDQIIYFRYMRYPLNLYANGELPEGSGNTEDVNSNSTFFRFDNMASSSYSNYGSGIQEPLKLLPIDCEVNLVMKSQLGPSGEIAAVVPYLYNLRYFKSQI